MLTGGSAHPALTYFKMNPFSIAYVLLKLLQEHVCKYSCCGAKAQVGVRNTENVISKNYLQLFVADVHLHMVTVYLFLFFVVIFTRCYARKSALSISEYENAYLSSSYIHI